MIEELIALIILLVGICGIVLIMRRKLPALLAFPKEEESFSIGSLTARFRERIVAVPILKNLSSPEALMQRILSAVRIFALRVEHRTAMWLEKLRRKNKEKNSRLSDDYWEQLKK